MEKKITKMEMFEAIKETIKEIEGTEEMVEFITKEQELITKKAEKAKERAENKKVKGDALREAVQAALTDELVIAEDIVAKVEIEGEDVTKAKVIARLTQLVKAGIAVKEQIKVDTRKRMAYKIASEETVEVATEEADSEE